MTRLICNFLNDIQDKHVFTHEDIIRETMGEGAFIYPLYKKAEYYFEMKNKGIILKTISKN